MLLPGVDIYMNITQNPKLPAHLTFLMKYWRVCLATFALSLKAIGVGAHNKNTLGLSKHQ